MRTDRIPFGTNTIGLQTRSLSRLRSRRRSSISTNGWRTRPRVPATRPTAEKGSAFRSGETPPFGGRRSNQGWTRRQACMGLGSSHWFEPGSRLSPQEQTRISAGSHGCTWSRTSSWTRGLGRRCDGDLNGWMCERGRLKVFTPGTWPRHPGLLPNRCGI